MNFVVVAVLLFISSQSQSGDEALLKELRARGLDQLVDAVSHRRLNDPNVDPATKQAAAFELAEATSRRASSETAAQARRSGWAEADALLEPHVQAATGVDAAAFEFRLRHALLIRDRAETAVELLKALPEDKELAADARNQARTAEDLSAKIAAETRKRFNQTVGGDAKKQQKMGELSHLAQFHAGIAALVETTALPPGEARSKSADESDRRLRYFTRKFAILPLTMEAFLSLGKLYKETERFDEALQIVSVFELHPETPKPYPQRAELLAAQILLAQNKPSAALAKLNVPEAKRVPNSPEWSVTLFEAMLRASRSDVAPPKSRRDDSIDLLGSLQKFGGYWKVRGEQVLAKYGEADIVGDNPALLGRVAALRRDRKEYDAAIAMFDQAAGLERAANSPERAARMSLAAAGAMLEKGDAKAAVERFSKIADDLGQAPLAADALLGAAGALHKAASTGDAAAKTAYRSALDRLLGLPKADPALLHEANWLRGKVADGEKDASTAVARFREIPSDHPRAVAAMGALAVLHHDGLLSAAGKHAGEQTVNAAIDDLERRMKASTASDPQTTKNRALAAWVLAKLYAEFKPERLAEAVKLVEGTVVADATFPMAQQRVWPTLLAWHLRLGDAKGATAVMNRAFGTDSRTVVDAMLKLSPLAEGLTPEESAARAKAAQATVDMFLDKVDQLPDRTRVGMRLLAAQALAAQRDYIGAVRLLKQLREDFPRDRRVAQVLGRVFFIAGEYRSSLQEWSTLVAGLPRGEEDWLNAVAEASRCHLELGDRSSARRLLAMVDNFKTKGSEGVRKKLDEMRMRADR